MTGLRHWRCPECGGLASTPEDVTEGVECGPCNVGVMVPLPADCDQLAQARGEVIHELLNRPSLYLSQIDWLVELCDAEVERAGTDA